MDLPSLGVSGRLATDARTKPNLMIIAGAACGYLVLLAAPCAECFLMGSPCVLIRHRPPTLGPPLPGAVFSDRYTGDQNNLGNRWETASGISLPRLPTSRRCL